MTLKINKIACTNCDTEFSLIDMINAIVKKQRKADMEVVREKLHGVNHVYLQGGLNVDTIIADINKRLEEG